MLTKVVNFIQGHLNHALSSTLPSHIKEQVALRAYLCQQCALATKCAHCGCKTPEMFYSPLKKDAQSRWAEFYSESQWNTLKNNIQDYVSYFEHLRSTEAAVPSPANNA